MHFSDKSKSYHVNNWYNFEAIDHSFSQGSNFLFQKQISNFFETNVQLSSEDVSRKPAYMLNKYQSVKNFLGMKVHSGQYCSTSVESSKFSNEILHVNLTFNILSQKCSDERKFGIESLQYLYRKMSKNEGNCWCGCWGNRCLSWKVSRWLIE